MNDHEQGYSLGRRGRGGDRSILLPVVSAKAPSTRTRTRSFPDPSSSSQGGVKRAHRDEKEVSSRHCRVCLMPNDPEEVIDYARGRPGNGGVKTRGLEDIAVPFLNRAPVI